MTSCFLKLYTPTRVCEVIIRNWSAGQPVSPKKPDSIRRNGRKKKENAASQTAQWTKGKPAFNAGEWTYEEGKRARETRAHRTPRGGEENSGSEGAGHRTMRGGMSGCHPDATTKKIAGERETREQKKEKTGRRCP